MVGQAPHEPSELSDDTSPPPSFSTALSYWLRLGLISFGGPAGQISIMQTDLVERRRWIAQGPFLSGLNLAMLLPGPEAQQLATYIGWRLHGLRGALAAGILFVAPGAVLLGILAWLAAVHGDAPVVAALFDGFRPVVVAIIACALWRLARRSLKSAAAWALAVAAFAALAILRVPFPLVIGAALLTGALTARMFPGLFTFGHGGAGGANPETDVAARGGDARRLVRLILVFAALWVGPVALVVGAFGTNPWAGIAELFTTAAFVTFGGAYAVLPYVAGEAVEHYRWLSSGDMINGLALAETTPGPLILVTQWIGWFAGYNQAGALPPVVAGVLGAALTTYVTFLPCFLFILAGAPYVDRVSRNATASAALGAVTAAVVGVIASLGVYIGRASLFPDSVRGDWGPDAFALAAALAALGVLLFTRIGIPWIVLAGGAAGIAARMVGLIG
ncbi:MAG: chromate efflux transporter [Alphaproteobacteria bacterium]|nr:chromate efflux transporter [Alphaproteobacteria bacterium]